MNQEIITKHFIQNKTFLIIAIYIYIYIFKEHKKKISPFNNYCENIAQFKKKKKLINYGSRILKRSSDWNHSRVA